MSSSCLPEPPSDCDNNTGGGDDFNAAASRGSPVTGLSVLNSQDSEMQMQLARLSRLMAPAGGSSTALPLECDAGFESSSLCGNFNNVDPESDDRPTAKQKRVARVVMAVAFILLSMCFVLIVVTLSMSDHIDRMVRKALMHSLSKARSQSSSKLSSEFRQTWNLATTAASATDN
uniref:Uncharacterized protein n=1 Tax=Macrostomum lignano TaxID=282301 RepID=A0A1I8J7J7_9PLAT